MLYNISGHTAVQIHCASKKVMTSAAFGKYQGYTERKHIITNKSIMKPVKANYWYIHERTTDPNE